VFEAAGGDAVNVVRFEFWRFIQCRNLLSGRIVVLFVQQDDPVVSHDEVVRPNFALLLSARL
jgi:hypothetical protein